MSSLMACKLNFVVLSKTYAKISYYIFFITMKIIKVHDIIAEEIFIIRIYSRRLIIIIYVHSQKGSRLCQILYGIKILT